MHILAYSTQMPELSKMSKMIKLEQPVVQRMHDGTEQRETKDSAR
jgi:hypothetical protein